MKYNCTQAATDSGYLTRYTDLVNSPYSTPGYNNSDFLYAGATNVQFMQ